MARVVLNYQTPARWKRAIWLNWGMGWMGYGMAGGIFGFFLLIFLLHPSYDRAGSAKHAAAETDLGEIHDAVRVFQLEMGRLPTPAEGLDVLMSAPADGAGKWHGPYLRHLPKDPWGRPYVYHQPGDTGGEPFTVLSFGPDRMPGGGDDIVR